MKVMIPPIASVRSAEMTRSRLRLIVLTETMNSHIHECESLNQAVHSRFYKNDLLTTPNWNLINIIKRL